MEIALRNVAALLGSTNRKLDIDTVADRKLLQKIVYLGQSLGLPLNYSFSWYIHGPYSPSLTQDYYALQSEAVAGELIDRYRLNEKYASVARKLNAALAAKPSMLDDADWAELLASVVFLKKESGLETAGVRAVLEKKKAHVSNYYDQAIKVLTKVGLSK